MSAAVPSGRSSPGTAARRLRRDERREQLLAAATRAFVGAGSYAATSLDDVAIEAGVTRVILYRHFDSKGDLYRAAVDRAAAHLHTAATSEGGELHEASVPAIRRWAAAEPDTFRLLFHQAGREQEFSGEADKVRAAMASALYPVLGGRDDPWGRWSAQLAVTIVIEAIMAWLDAGRPDPDQVDARILLVVDGVFRAAGVPTAEKDET